MKREEIPMIQIGNVIVSIDCLKEKFCCDLEVCKGACCIEGEAGAPVTIEEIALLEEVLPEIENELAVEARKTIDRQGVAYTDIDGDLVTSIINGKDCVFTCYDPKGGCFCTVDKAYREGRVLFSKPISCDLYPIRVSELGDGMTALNYHRWEICNAALIKGKEQNIRIYEFLRGPLIRRFGEGWYNELKEVAISLREQGYIS